MITYKLKINYQDPRVMTSDMEFVTGDVGAYRLEFEFYDNGARVDLTDCVLTVKAKRSDGTVLADAGEIQDNLGVFVPKNDIYAVAGELRLEVALADAAKNYITAKVLLATVVEGLGDADNVAQTSASVYVTLLNRVQEQIIAANKLTEDAKSLIDGKLELKADKQTEDGGFAEQLEAMQMQTPAAPWEVQRLLPAMAEPLETRQRPGQAFREAIRLPSLWAATENISTRFSLEQAQTKRRAHCRCMTIELWTRTEALRPPGCPATAAVCQVQTTCRDMPKRETFTA